MHLNSIVLSTLSISLPIPHKIETVITVRIVIVTVIITVTVVIVTVTIATVTVTVIVRISFDNNDVQGLVVHVAPVDEGVMSLSPTIQIFTPF